MDSYHFEEDMNRKVAAWMKHITRRKVKKTGSCGSFSVGQKKSLEKTCMEEKMPIAYNDKTG